MSLVPTYVEDQSGRWYMNPAIRRKDWFICWDDSEPIELVVKREADITPEEIIEQLNEAGWEIEAISKPQHMGSRIFEVPTNEVERKTEFFPATRVFLRQEYGPPLSLMRGIPMCSFRRPEEEGVYYLGRKNSKNGS